MRDYVERTIKAYDNSVSRYEAATREMMPDTEIDRFAELLPQRNGYVLDVGCAYGRDAGLLAGRGISVMGIDLSRELLRRAAELQPDLQLYCMDACSLGIADDCLQGVWCQAVLLHLRDEDIHVALGEFARALVQGGVIFASFKEGEGSEEIIEAFSSDSIRYYKYQSVRNICALLNRAGLSVEHIEKVNERARYGPGYRDITWIHAYAVKR